MSQESYGRRLVWEIAFIGSLVTLWGGGWLAYAEETPPEYQVKAAFIFNFAKFVEWPQHAFKGPEDPIEICILGQNVFGNSLEEVIHRKIIEGRTLVVRHITDIEPPENKCQILFVHSSERKPFRLAARSLSGRAVLTISDMPGFSADGGVITLRLESGKVRFEINVNAAARAKLHISSKLLRLAQVVHR
jgi:hypothetical protein